MDFNEYQEGVKDTTVFTASITRITQEESPWVIADALELSYIVMGLAGEAGEICNKVKKLIRDQDGKITYKDRELLAEEAGDVLWYLSALCTSLGFTLEEVAQANADKLQDRKKRGVLGGSGDKR